MPTLDQIRAARALLDWSQHDLAGLAGLSQTGIARIENGTNHPNSKTMQKIEAAFDRADIEFIDTTGVKKRSGDIRTLRGEDAMSHFLDDVFDCILLHGKKDKPLDVFLSNVVHENWITWMGSERWNAHTARMQQNKQLMKVKILVKEGDYNFPASSYSTYKWMPEEYFNEKSFYSYHDRLALLNFQETNLEILIIKHQDFAKGYRDLFSIAWNNLAVTPPYKK